MKVEWERKFPFSSVIIFKTSNLLNNRVLLICYYFQLTFSPLQLIQNLRVSSEKAIELIPFGIFIATFPMVFISATPFVTVFCSISILPSPNPRSGALDTQNNVQISVVCTSLESLTTSRTHIAVTSVYEMWVNSRSWL